MISDFSIHAAKITKVSVFETLSPTPLILRLSDKEDRTASSSFFDITIYFDDSAEALALAVAIRAILQFPSATQKELS